MAETRQSVSETLADIAARRPVLEPVLHAFSPLLEARAALLEKLSPLVRESGFLLPQWEQSKAKQGVPLLAGVSLSRLAPAFREAARVLLPLIEALPGMAEYTSDLDGAFLQDETFCTHAVEALIAGNESGLESLTRQTGLAGPVLLFALETIAGPVLHVAAGEKTPWDTHPAAWTQGFCPVCGSYPSIAYMDRRVFDEKNPFLAGGGGKKHLHCGICGTDWYFRRGACPACGKEGSGTMELLRETSGNKGERVDWCTACKTYCPAVDLRERDTTPDMDAMALGMMHLDIVASGKGLQPLKPSFWNQF